MLYSQYLRVEKRAGGVLASKRELIRAGHQLISKKGKSRDARTRRHYWLRQILKQNKEERKFIKEYCL
jgi:hypothetical protein